MRHESARFNAPSLPDSSAQSKGRRPITDQSQAGPRNRRRQPTAAPPLVQGIAAAETITTNSAQSWLRVDLHVHTPASTDYQQSGVSALDILRKAEERGLDVVAFTDHNSVRGYADLWREIEDLELLDYLNRMAPAEAERLAEYRRLLGKILLLPGFEFTATFGFHILAIFPETTSIRLMEHLLLTLGVPEDRFGSGEVGATSDVLRVYEVLAEHGAIVIGAHVNSTHGIAMQGIRFGGQTKIAYTQDPRLCALEVTDLDSNSRRSTATFFSGIKAEYPRRMHCIQGSDAHRLDRDPVRDTNLGIGDRATEILLSEPSFAALKAVFKSADFSKIRPARPGGPAADALHAARDAGNTIAHSFHERLSQTRGGSQPILRDIVAFANGNGGTIYVGVGPADRRTVPGVPEAARAIESWRSDASGQITPALELTVDTIDYGGKTVVALHVSDGPEKPYALAPAAILIRRGSETAVATRDEIVAMVRSVPRIVSVEEAPAPTEKAAPADLAPLSPGPVPVARARDGRRSSRQPGQASHPPIASQGSVAPLPHPATATAVNGSGPAGSGEQMSHDAIAPRTGAEIVDVEERDGIVYYSIRDLRNGSVTTNVTRDSARRLWQYAIHQYEEHRVDEGHIRWKGDLGFWKVYRPSRGERRYNLAFRGEGKLRVFYGVGDDGLDERWRMVIPAPRVAAE